MSASSPQSGISRPPAIEPYAENFFVLVLISLPVLIIGLLWFGVLNLRHRMMAQARWLPLATGLMGFIGFFLFSGGEINATFLFFRTLFALGLAGLGLLMWLDKLDPGELASP
jgi:hypothetical protein